MLPIICYLVLGCIAGLLAGMLGIGGGIVIVPSLYFLFRWMGFDPQILMHLAVGSSLASVIFTSLTSAYGHHQKKAVLWPMVRKLSLGILVGALLGSLIADKLPTATLRIFFGFFECYVAVHMWLGFKPKPSLGQLPSGIFNAFGVIIGIVSALLGIGGGTLTVPFLLWANQSIREAVATSAACGFPIAVAGTLGFIFMGWNLPVLPEWSSGYIYWPAVIGIISGSMVMTRFGVKIAHSIDMKTLKRLFAVIVAIVGIKMLI